MTLSDMNLNTVDALPEEAKYVIKGLIEGRFKSFCFVAECNDDVVTTAIYTNIDDQESNNFAVLGGIAALQRDFLRSRIESCVPYQEKDE